MFSYQPRGLPADSKTSNDFPGGMIMLRRQKISVAVITLLLAVVAAAGRAAPQPDAEAIISDMRQTVKGLESYSFIIRRQDLNDNFVQERNREAMAKYKVILDQLERLHKRKDVEVNEVEKDYKESISHLSFVSPFTVEMVLLKSEYLPSFLQKSVVAYNPDINPLELYMRTPGFGFTLKKEIETDSAIVLEANWKYEMIELECAIANGGVPRVAGTDEHKGKEYIILEVPLMTGRKEWKMGCGGDSYDVPQEVFVQLDKELGMVASRIEEYAPGNSVSRLWIDPGLNLIVRKEMNFGDTTGMKYVITDIELDNVDPGKLYQPEQEK